MNMRWMMGMAGAGLLMVLPAACLNVDAKMDLGKHGDAGYEDEYYEQEAQAPETSSWDDCQAKLREAYHQIAVLKRENKGLRDKVGDLEKDKDELKRKCDRYKDERDDYKKRYERKHDDD
jgi:predicted RNase H-like nuclease (RuvC/YqgF family)